MKNPQPFIDMLAAPSANGGPALHRKHFVALDGLRGVAAVAVVLYHRRWFAPDHTALLHGYMAVCFFFILSGFVIDHAYRNRLRQSMPLRQFFKLRAIRLYPLIVFGALLGGAVAIGEAYFDRDYSGMIRLAAATLFAATCLPGLPLLTPERPFFINGPLWSLFFELVANAVYAIALVKLKMPALVLFCAAAVGLSVVMALQLNTLDAGFLYPQLGWGFTAVAAPFTIGVLLNRVRTVCTFPSLPFWAASLLLLISFRVPAAPAPWDGLFQVGMMLVFYPAIILCAAQCEPVGWWHKIAKASAYISYPVYALHYPVMDALDHAKIKLGGANWLWLAVETGAAIAFAYIVARWYDEPVRSWLSKRFSARTKAVGGGSEPLSAA